VIARWKGIVEEIHFGASIMPSSIIENLDLKKPSFRPSKWPRKLKPAKNSKLPKWPENCFEPFGKDGWPPLSTWIIPLRKLSYFLLSPSDGEIWMPSWLSSLKQPLVELAGCSVTLRRSLSGFLLHNTELKEFSSSCACLHTSSNAHLAEYLLPEHPTVMSSVHSLHLLNAHLAELFRILSDYGSPF
jgi:hypothetical protein